MSMSQQTAIGEALTRAGANIGKTRLYNTAVDLLRSCRRNPIVAHDSFVEALEADSPMLAAMLGHEEVAKRALDYLRSVSGDMSGLRSGGQRHRDDQLSDAPAPLSDDAGRGLLDTQQSCAASSETSSADVGQTRVDDRKQGAHAGANVKHFRKGQTRGDAHGPVARPEVLPNPSRGFSAIHAMNVAVVSVMDTYRIDGRSIGDWTLGEAMSAGREKTRHGALLLALGRHYANAAPDMLVRDAIKVEDLQREIQRASEMTDAA